MKRKLFDLIRVLWKIPFLERMLAKATLDKPFGSFATKLPPNHYQYAPNTIRNVSRHGISYRLDLSDIVDWYIYYGFLETSRQQLLGLMNPGQVIIDVGANVGAVSMNAAKIIGAEGTVHAFEPDPTNFKRMEANLTLNTFTNIHKNSLGLGDQAGSFTIANVEAGNQGMNRIVQDASKGYEIQVVTLDSYAKDQNLTQVDLIKIDVEGFEFNVLKGSQTVIDQFHPIFFIELDDANLNEQGSSAIELVRFLTERKYKVRHAETGESINESTNFSNCHYDIIAIHQA